MARSDPPPLSKRERQILDVIYRRGEATAMDVHRELPRAPTYTTVRGLLRILEEKRHVRHRVEGTRYVYSATAPREAAGRSHLSHVVRTFFDGSRSGAVAALLGTDTPLAPAELDEIERLISQARRTRK